MKIYAPVKDANGVWASVKFVNGVVETDNPNLIAWFKEHGYKVDEPISGIADNCKIADESEFVDINKVADDEPEETEEVEMMGYAEKPHEPDEFDNMTPLELRDWAVAHGLGGEIRGIRNKEKLLKIVRG